MKPEDIIKIIDELPKYICYIYPGYISIYLYYYFHALTVDDTTAKLLKSVVISYFYVILTRGTIGLLNKITNIGFNLSVTGIMFNFILIIFAFVIPYVLYRVETSKKFLNNIRAILKINTSFAKNEIESIQKKYKDTIWIYVYMKDSNLMYEGSLTEKELEIGRTRFFCLSKYRKYVIKDDGKKIKLKDYSDDDKEKVLIYFEHISHFEIANIDKEE